MNHRKIKRGFGKLGIFCLGLVLALAVCGVGYAHWSDTLSIEGTISTGTWDAGGTIGFWGSWDEHNTYTQGQIEGWLGNIDGDSHWLVPDMDEDEDIDIDDMQVIFQGAQGGTMKEKFLGHYLAARLNTKPDPPNLALDTVHSITNVPVEKDGVIQYIDASPYFGYDSGTLEQIILTIESKYTENPTPDQFEIMKNICDALNNLEI